MDEPVSHKEMGHGAPASDGKPSGNTAVVDWTREEVDLLIAQQYNGLMLLLQRRTKDPSVAAEILHEAVLTALKALQGGGVADPDRLPGYIYRVALNLYRNHKRNFDNRSDLRASAEFLDSMPSDEASHEERTDLEKIVRLMIKDMPSARDRDLLVRFYLDDESSETIQRDLGISPTQFSKIVHRARARIRGLLEARGFSRFDF